MDESATRKQIAEDLVASGLKPGGVALFHSSLKSMGQAPGGPETVILGLLDALGPEGTLLAPTLSYKSVTREAPVFDVRTTPSCVGAITEHFRTREGSIRSVNPTHSVCGVGPRAEELLAAHIEDDTPCGPNSPYRKLRAVGGQILMLGCGFKPNTSMHGAEEVIGTPYVFDGTVTYQIALGDGERVEKTYSAHGFAGYKQRYDRLEDLLLPSELSKGKVLEAEVNIIEAAPMWEKALAAMRVNPLWFVEEKN